MCVGPPRGEEERGGPVPAGGCDPGEHGIRQRWWRVRILLISDHEPTLRTLPRGLRAEGFRVETAEDAREGDRLAQAGHADVILLDLALPGGSLTTLRQWRDRGLAAYVLVLVSRSTSLADRVRSLEMGGDGYLSRPVHIEELAARLRALKRRGETPPDPVLRIRDLVINTATKTVERGGQVIPLTRREYALLRFLAVNRGKVVSRSMIRDHLYDDDDNTSNVISVYIRYLRQKIDEGFEVPLILTRWGQGYLLRGDSA